jgi:hypothetical protein
MPLGFGNPSTGTAWALWRRLNTSISWESEAPIYPDAGKLMGVKVGVNASGMGDDRRQATILRPGPKRLLPG